MSLDETTNPDSLSNRLEFLAREALDRFLGALIEGREPRIEEELAIAGEVARPVILRELLIAELQWRRERGEVVDVRDLLSRFPDHLSLIEEILGGNSPTVTTPYHQVWVDAPEVSTRVGDSTGSTGRYQIRNEHARGGLGVVSLALDRELHRDVAIKEIRPDSAHLEQFRARFIREAEVTARLEHPGIVPIYGIGHHEDGRPYYVMRFIKGETLKAAAYRLHNIKPRSASAEIEADPIVPRQTLPMLVGRLIDACHTMAYAHHRKILHRDIKPENIMLGPFGETLVVDWGLAKTIDHPESHDEETLRAESDSPVSPTRVGSRLGTVGYMSPEQASGALAELGPTSDVYSLGATLYFLLTGKSPAENSQAEESLRKTRKEGSIRPSSRALEAICLKAIAFRPVDRYPTAEALAEDLERWRAGEPVQAAPESPIERLARWSRTHQTALATAGVLLVSTTIGLAVVAVQEGRTNQRIRLEVELTRRAELEARNAVEVARDAKNAAIEDRAAAKADLMTTRQSLRKLMEGLNEPEISYLLNSGGPRFTLALNVLKLYQKLIEEHPDDPDVKYELAIASRNSANIARTNGMDDQAEPLYLQSLELLTTLLAESPGSDDYRIELAQTTIDQGSHFQMSGRPRQAEGIQIKALEILGRRRGSIPEFDERYRRNTALARLDLGSCRLEMSRASEALPELDKASEILKGLGEKPEPFLVDRLYLIGSLIDRGLALGELEKPVEAWKALDEAARIVGELRKMPVKDNLDLRWAEAIVVSRQGRLFAIQENHAESLNSYDHAFKVIAELYQFSFRPPFIDRELVVAWLGRAEARLELLGPQPAPDQLKLIQADLNKALKSATQLANLWKNHYDYQAILGQSHQAISRLWRINKQDLQALQSLRLSHECYRRACELNPDEKTIRDTEQKVRDELKQLDEGRPDPAIRP